MENPMNFSSKMTGLALLAVSTASAQNLLVNSDFESGIDSWITFNKWFPTPTTGKKLGTYLLGSGTVATKKAMSNVCVLIQKKQT